MMLKTHKLNTFLKPRLHKQLGQLLLDAGLINKLQLAEALKVQQKTNDRIGKILIKLNYINEQNLIDFLSEQLFIPVVENGTLKKLNKDVVKVIPEHLAKKYTMIAVAQENGKINVVMSDPLNAEALDDLSRVTRLDVCPLLGNEKIIAEAIDIHYRAAGEEKAIESLVRDLAEVRLELEKDRDFDTSEYLDLNKLKIEAGDAPVVKLVNFIIAQAIKDKSSDIHIESDEKFVNIRYRVDGILYKLIEVPRKMNMAITSRVKILADMDIAERRVPQDGSFSIRFNAQDYDIRVSTLPTIFGEKVVMRLLEKDAVMNYFTLETLGFKAEQLAIFKKYIFQPHGMVLITGPTGSGKTTTLYCALHLLNAQEKNIITLEDPVEYRLKGVQQVHVRSDIGLSFSDGLRSVLRQDPDVILVGEIRDQETAVMAIRSSMTGHLVLSTLHTNDAVGTVLRLIDLGVDPFLVTSNVNIAVSQRLVRVNCPYCKEPYEPDGHIKDVLGELWQKIYENGHQVLQGKGCTNCRNTGYKGRIGVYEVVEFDPEIKDLILKGAPHYEVKSLAIKKGSKTIRQSGIEKIIEGITTPEEVLAACLDTEETKEKFDA